MLVCCVNEQEKYTQHLRERNKGKSLHTNI